MARLTSASAAGIVFLLSATTAGFADVTAEQVWEGWSKQYTAYGYQLAVGSTERVGDTLELRDIDLSQSVEGSSFTMRIPELNFTEKGDGTVEVTFSDEIKAKAEAAEEGQPAMSMDLTIRKSNAQTIVSGTPEAMSYDYNLPEVQIEMDQAVAGAEQSVPVKVLLGMTGVTGIYDVTQSDAGQKIVSNGKAAGLKLAASGADPETNSTFVMEGHLADLTMTSDAMMPANVDMQDMAAALAKGFSVSVSATHGVADYTLEATANEGPTNMAGSAQSGSLEFKMSPEGLRYAASGKQSVLTVQTAQFPAPMQANFEDTTFDFALPVSKSETAAPFVAKIGLIGLTVSEELWAMFDPGAKLPRDPATLVIDLAGKAKPLFDLFSPEFAQAAAPPVELESLDIKALQLTLAGADLSGNGAMTFDNSMGMPMPIGAIDLKLAGANKLIDTLVGMGLVPEDQAMFGRMMLGAYAVPAGDDLLTSKIEFKQGGEILANGQRIQ